MNVLKLNECGYEESALGFSLSYNSTIDRAKELFPTYAFKGNGESKFLESIYIWVDVNAFQGFGGVKRIHIVFLRSKVLQPCTR